MVMHSSFWIRSKRVHANNLVPRKPFPTEYVLPSPFLQPWMGKWGVQTGLLVPISPGWCFEWKGGGGGGKKVFSSRSLSLSSYSFSSSGVLIRHLAIRGLWMPLFVSLFWGSLNCVFSKKKCNTFSGNAACYSVGIGIFKLPAKNKLAK